MSAPDTAGAPGVRAAARGALRSLEALLAARQDTLAALEAASVAAEVSDASARSSLQRLRVAAEALAEDIVRLLDQLESLEPPAGPPATRS